MLKIFAGLLTMSWGFAAHGASQVHYIYDIGPEVFADCEAAIDTIAERISAANGVEVNASFCEVASVTRRTNGVISYVAEQRLNEVSTYTFQATYAPKGVYPSKIRCEEALANEVEQFRGHTGLVESYAFCAVETLRHRNAWYPHITAFGQPERSPNRVTWSTDAPHGTSLQDFTAALNNHFAQGGLTFQYSVYHHAGASGSITALYYGAPELDSVYLSGRSVATIPGLDRCSAIAQRLDSENVFLRNAPMITAYCSSGYSNPTRFELVMLFEGMPSVDTVQHAQAFSNFTACEAARPAIESQLRIVHGPKLAATLCGQPRYSSVQTFHVIAVKSY